MTPHLPLSFLRIHAADSVAVALRPLEMGERLAGIVLRSDIPKGHKLALHDHAPGAVVTKYGQSIGRATAPIMAGEHVHTHNLATALHGELHYTPSELARSDAPATASEHLWQGYRRADGMAATRNEVWILPTVGCVGLTAEEVARAARDRHGAAIDGIFAFAHPHGCSQLGDDLNGTRTLLAGLATNPNAAGVLLLGLGCESNQLDAMVEAIPASSRGKLRCLTSQSVGDELAAAGRLWTSWSSRQPLRAAKPYHCPHCGSASNAADRMASRG